MYQRLPVWANKVGPFSNPSETYPYYDLPYCQPNNTEFMPQDIGQVLRGDRFVSTGFDIEYQKTQKNRMLCQQDLDSDDMDNFRSAIDQDYYFELVVDDMPLLGFVGEKEALEGPDGSVARDQYFVFTHLDFEFHYDVYNQIVDANVTADPRYRQEIISRSGPIKVDFSYSVKWKPTDRHHSHRIEKYSMSGFREKHIQVHWISIANSCVLVLMLTGFLGLILLRVLRNDIARTIELDEEEQLMDGAREDDCGWKKISGDVFRLPGNPLVLTALLGMGSQMLVLVLSVIVVSTFGVMYPYARGAMHYIFIVLFTFTAAVAGFVSAYMYRKIGTDQGRKWVWNVVLSGCLFPVPLFVVALLNNAVALQHGTTQALPFMTMMQVFFMWALLCMPFTVIGGVIGRRVSSALDPPCRTSKAPRQVPETTFLRSQPVQLLLAGFLPFR
eukprot:TRINITY_DN1201_c0_g1_i1.p1 TRINITY_DN1201_c0_g1~~TRINITY_DN1201_c0_g1_i1.p1  ORF type:complete len:443 (-),score=103.29 TRINITY_DN1201_c0_g1_i1:792-2120(-)